MRPVERSRREHVTEELAMEEQDLHLDSEEIRQMAEDEDDDWDDDFEPRIEWDLWYEA